MSIKTLRETCRYVGCEDRGYSLSQIAGTEELRFFRGFDRESLILLEEEIDAAAELLAVLRKRTRMS